MPHPAAVIVTAFLATVVATAQAAAQISELRAGVGWHDPGIISFGREDGPSGSIEVLFDSPGFLAAIWAPRPHLGVTVSGQTSQAYAGLSFEWDLTDRLFAGFSVGGMIHTADLDTRDPDEARLGSRVLFRESITLGVRINESNSVSLTADHASNAFLADENEGLDTIMLRYGYRF